MTSLVTASAPGKLVLFGEYAVLAGAPGAAMALTAEARCSFEADPSTRRWTIETLGFESERLTTYLPAIIIEPPPPEASTTHLLWHALNSIKGQVNELPAGGTLTLDSRTFQQQGRKLGIGSSAAVCTALTGLLETLADGRPSIRAALLAHRTAQGGRGSGLDVAAAFHGALTELRSAPNAPAQIRPLPWNHHLAYQIYWTGTAASTTAFITRFSDWLTDHRQHPALRALCHNAERLSEHMTLQAFQSYVAALQAFDDATGLGIYTPMHQELHDLAVAAEVVYKPCGAGGGDIGIALAESDADLSRLQRSVEAHWATEAGTSEAQPVPLALRLTQHGIRIQSR